MLGFYERAEKKLIKKAGSGKLRLSAFLPS